MSMEFIVIFFGLYALIFVIAGVGAFALYFVRGIITILGAIWHCGKWIANTMSNMALSIMGRQAV